MGPLNVIPVSKEHIQLSKEQLEIRFVFRVVSVMSHLKGAQLVRLIGYSQ